MGMLMHHTWQEQQKAKPVEVAEEVKADEIPFTDPEEPVEEPVKRTVRKTNPPAVNRRRKSTGK